MLVFHNFTPFQSIMLVKGCLELLLVFINYKEDVNSNLVVKAVHAVDAKQGKLFKKNLFPRKFQKE